MRETVAGRRGQGLLSQALGARQISRGCVGHIINDTTHEPERHSDFRLDGLRVERQRALEQSDCLSPSFARRRPPSKYSTSTKNIVQCIVVVGWPSGLRLPELEVERDCD